MAIADSYDSLATLTMPLGNLLAGYYEKAIEKKSAIRHAKFLGIGLKTRSGWGFRQAICRLFRDRYLRDDKVKGVYPEVVPLVLEKGRILRQKSLWVDVYLLTSRPFWGSYHGLSTINLWPRFKTS